VLQQLVCMWVVAVLGAVELIWSCQMAHVHQPSLGWWCWISWAYPGPRLAPTLRGGAPCAHSLSLWPSGEGVKEFEHKKRCEKWSAHSFKLCRTLSAHMAFWLGLCSTVWCSSGNSSGKLH
jgi:hypothetical protein